MVTAQKMAETDLNSAELRSANEAIIESWRKFFDLKVTLTAELGRTKMTAREILNLELHGIIQLSRSTGEGVDLVADDKYLARGEIIMVEDRTGIRINEVIVPEE
jgi:flagellar motor switch protein FliN